MGGPEAETKPKNIGWLGTGREIGALAVRVGWQWWWRWWWWWSLTIGEHRAGRGKGWGRCAPAAPLGGSGGGWEEGWLAVGGTVPFNSGFGVGICHLCSHNQNCCRSPLPMCIKPTTSCTGTADITKKKRKHKVRKHKKKRAVVCQAVPWAGVEAWEGGTRPPWPPPGLH